MNTNLINDTHCPDWCTDDTEISPTAVMHETNFYVPGGRVQLLKVDGEEPEIWIEGLRDGRLTAEGWSLDQLPKLLSTIIRAAHAAGADWAKELVRELGR